ncbi:MAG: sugar porter family MFS transporter [Candidatus Accumulibacter sp.]|jgi:sugar porter (SP) family MFS transporter|nr:sugar porter family MFS transporter [Accumulibacter sp.]
MKINTGFIFFFGAMGGLLFGFDTGIISGASPLIEKSTDLGGLGLNEWQTGFIVSAVLIGSAIGALSVGSLSDKFGRKPLLIIAAVLFIVGALFCAIAPNFLLLVLARIILGLAVGGASALTPAYLAELAPAAKRGSLGTLFQLMITLGILLAYVGNLGFLGHNIAGIQDWRWMLGCALIPAVVLFLGSLLLPESPRFLIANGKAEQGKAVLNHLRANTGENVAAELADIEATASQPKGGVAELLKIASPAVIVAVGIMFLQQLVGINSVIYFLPQVFIKGFGFAEDQAIWISIGIGIVNFAVTTTAIFIMDKFDRKKLFTFGSIVMALSLGILTLLNFTVPVEQAAVPTIILIAVYIFGFALTWGPMAWVLIGEIFPLSVRGVGASIGSAANWIGNFIVSQFFLILLAAFGNNVGGPFGIFAIFSVLSIFFVKYLVPETRGKSLEEIESELRAHTAKQPEGYGST